MLNSVISQQNGRYGVINLDDSTGFFTQIVPLKYCAITFFNTLIIAQNFDGTSDVYNFQGSLLCEQKALTLQKYGMVSLNPDETSTAYDSMGSVILTGGKNILFLDKNLLLVTNPKTNTCHIYNYEKKRFLNTPGFEVMLYFCGSNPQAQPYSAATNISQIISTLDYMQNGAHIESLVCGVVNGYWGIFNIYKNRVEKNFIYKTMVQYADSQIYVLDDSGKMIPMF
ncbi:MAG: hypothetical protein IJ890_03095 [Clostridia bacterium]|nr:hypothetical protein [Clostridia bacterium]